jgi:hypothetical protein
LSGTDLDPDSSHGFRQLVRYLQQLALEADLARPKKTSQTERLLVEDGWDDDDGDGGGGDGDMGPCFSRWTQLAKCAKSSSVMPNDRSTGDICGQPLFIPDCFLFYLKKKGKKMEGPSNLFGRALQRIFVEPTQ